MNTKMDGDRRTVGERGQVTIPKELRRRVGIEGGDEVIVYAEGGKLVIDRPVDPDDLATGYRARAQRATRLQEELESLSGEGDDHLGEAPGWSE